LFQFGELLGQGNGGKVVAGVHKASGTPLAIKVKHNHYNRVLSALD